jgi:hypothetical protein
MAKFVKRVTSGGTDISLEIRGYDRVQNSMRKILAAHPKGVNAVMRVWSIDVEHALKRKAYGRPPENSRYVRTYNLRRSWKAVQTKEARWTITNKAVGPNGRFYARYVVGEDGDTRNQRQAWMHKGRWWQVGKVIQKDYVPKLTKDLGNLYESLWYWQ